MRCSSTQTRQKNYQCQAGVDSTEWDCSLWAGFGTTFAYVQTGQFGYVVNGTTLALAKKGSGVANKVNPCLWRFLKTKEYHDICQKHHLTAQCYPNQYFTSQDYSTKEYNLPTQSHTGDCSNGYCPCVVPNAQSSGCAGRCLVVSSYAAAMFLVTLAHLTQ